MLSTRFSVVGYDEKALKSLAARASVIGREVDRDKIPADEYKEAFVEAVGEAVIGYAATNFTEVDRLRAENKPAILFVEDYLPEATPYLQKISGLVIQGKVAVSLHLRTLVSNYSITALRANIVDEDNRKKINFGDEITIDAKSDYLYFSHLELKETFTDKMKSEEEFIDEKVAEYIKENSDYTKVNKLQFKTNFDYIGRDIGYDIGLMRTEHMVLASREQTEAFKAILLSDENLEENYKIFSKVLADDLEEVIEKNPDRKIRVRLLDLPANELFSNEDDLKKIKMLYGYARGVQMAQRRPEIYQAQVEAILTQVKKHPEAKGIEILVPTVRNLNELRFAKDIVDEAAEKLQLSKKSYKFGSMIETLNACNNIEALVPLCDFVNFGCNDLTSEIFECSRCDGKAIKELCDINGGINPFYILHKDVKNKISEVSKKIKALKPEMDICLCGDNIMTDYHLFYFQRDSLVDSVSFPPNAKFIYKARLNYNSAILSSIEEMKLGIEENPASEELLQKAGLLPTTSKKD